MGLSLLAFTQLFEIRAKNLDLPAQKKNFAKWPFSSFKVMYFGVSRKATMTK